MIPFDESSSSSTKQYGSSIPYGNELPLFYFCVILRCTLDNARGLLRYRGTRECYGHITGSRSAKPTHSKIVGLTDLQCPGNEEL